MQFRVDLLAFQGDFPQACWRQVKGNQRRNAGKDAVIALQALACWRQVKGLQRRYGGKVAAGLYRFRLRLVLSNKKENRPGLVDPLACYLGPKCVSKCTSGILEIRSKSGDAFSAIHMILLLPIRPRPGRTWRRRPSGSPRCSRRPRSCPRSRTPWRRLPRCGRC